MATTIGRVSVHCMPGLPHWRTRYHPHRLGDKQRLTQQSRRARTLQPRIAATAERCAQQQRHRHSEMQPQHQRPQTASKDQAPAPPPTAVRSALRWRTCNSERTCNSAAGLARPTAPALGRRSPGVWCAIRRCIDTPRDARIPSQNSCASSAQFSLASTHSRRALSWPTLKAPTVHFARAAELELVWRKMHQLQFRRVWLLGV